VPQGAGRRRRVRGPQRPPPPPPPPPPPEKPPPPPREPEPPEEPGVEDRVRPAVEENEVSALPRVVKLPARKPCVPTYQVGPATCCPWASSRAKMPAQRSAAS